MRASVTGASGFIGRRLVDKLIVLGWDVTVLTRRDGSWDAARPVKVVRGDLADEHSDLSDFVEDCDVLFHCAGELYRPELMEALHVGGARRLAAAAQARNAAGATPLHWVNLSSVGAYGPPREPNERRVVREDFPTAPVGPYEITKTRADEIVLDASKNGALTSTIVRPSNVFGETMTNASLRGLLSMVRQRLFFYVGDRDAMANYVHVDDVVDALIACGTNPAARNRVFNVAHDCRLETMITDSATALGVAPPQLRVPEWTARLAASAGALLPRFPLTHARINALVGHTHYACDALHDALGVRPSITVAERARAMLGMPAAETA